MAVRPAVLSEFGQDLAQLSAEPVPQEDLLKRMEGALVELSYQNMQLRERLDRARSHKKELMMLLQGQLQEANATLEKATSSSSKQLEDNLAVMNKQHERFNNAFAESRDLHAKRRALDADLIRLRNNNDLLKDIVTLVIPSGGIVDCPGIAPAVTIAALKASHAIK